MFEAFEVCSNGELKDIQNLALQYESIKGHLSWGCWDMLNVQSVHEFKVTKEKPSVRRRLTSCRLTSCITTCARAREHSVHHSHACVHEVGMRLEHAA